MGKQFVAIRSDYVKKKRRASIHIHQYNRVDQIQLVYCCNFSAKRATLSRRPSKTAYLKIVCTPTWFDN